MPGEVFSGRVAFISPTVSPTTRTVRVRVEVMNFAGNPSLMDPSKAPSYSPGPLELPNRDPVMLAGESGKNFDGAYDAYFEIQSAMAADQTPPTVALNTLLGALNKLEILPDVPDDAQSRFARARRGAARMDGSLETAREAFRSVSHAMLHAATMARGPKTAKQLTHFYCPMVPGGGGDWMQPGGELANPYWGDEMLRCGEVVKELGVKELGEGSGKKRVVVGGLSGGVK